MANEELIKPSFDNNNNDNNGPTDEQMATLKEYEIKWQRKRWALELPRKDRLPNVLKPAIVIDEENGSPAMRESMCLYVYIYIFMFVG